jgi:hypothetical protein
MKTPVRGIKWSVGFEKGEGIAEPLIFEDKKGKKRRKGNFLLEERNKV